MRRLKEAADIAKILPQQRNETENRPRAILRLREKELQECPRGCLEIL